MKISKNINKPLLNIKQLLIYVKGLMSNIFPMLMHAWEWEIALSLICYMKLPRNIIKKHCQFT